MKRLLEDIRDFLDQENIKETRIYKKLCKIDELLQIETFVTSLTTTENSDFMSEINDVSVKFIIPDEISNNKFPPMKFHLKFNYCNYYIHCLAYMWISMDQKIPNRIVANDDFSENDIGIFIYEDKCKKITADISNIDNILQFIHNMSIEYCGYDVFAMKYWEQTNSAYRKFIPDFVPLIQ